MAPRILIVLTSHGEHEGHETGWWLSEFAHPYDILSKKAEITIASPKGGLAPLNTFSTQPQFNDATTTHIHQHASALWEHTQPLAAFAERAEDFDAIFFPGGYGPVFDVTDDPAARQLVRDMHAQGKVIAAVCHGPAALLNVVLADGTPFLRGKKVAGLSDAEERAGGADTWVPFSLESRLREVSGGGYSCGRPYEEYTVVDNDGKLITGQNPASAASVAHAIAKALGI